MGALRDYRTRRYLRNRGFDVDSLYGPSPLPLLLVAGLALVLVVLSFTSHRGTVLSFLGVALGIAVVIGLLWLREIVLGVAGMALLGIFMGLVYALTLGRLNLFKRWFGTPDDAQRVSRAEAKRPSAPRPEMSEAPAREELQGASPWGAWLRERDAGL